MNPSQVVLLVGGGLLVAGRLAPLGGHEHPRYLERPVLVHGPLVGRAGSGAVEARPHEVVVVLDEQARHGVEQPVAAVGAVPPQVGGARRVLQLLHLARQLLLPLEGLRPRDLLLPLRRRLLLVLLCLLGMNRINESGSGARTERLHSCFNNCERFGPM